MQKVGKKLVHFALVIHYWREESALSATVPPQLAVATGVSVKMETIKRVDRAVHACPGDETKNKCWEGVAKGRGTRKNDGKAGEKRVVIKLTNLSFSPNAAGRTNAGLSNSPPPSSHPNRRHRLICQMPTGRPLSLQPLTKMVAAPPMVPSPSACVAACMWVVSKPAGRPAGLCLQPRLICRYGGQEKRQVVVSAVKWSAVDSCVCARLAAKQ